MHDANDSDGILDRLERRALETAAEEVLEPELDVREALGTDATAGAAPDLTLGGYMEEHDRPPAFTGTDEQPYTVAVDVEPTDDRDRPYAGFLVFLRWAATGAGILDHVESDDLAFGRNEEEARQAVLDLSLFEVKAALDAAIDRRHAELDV